MCILQLFYFCYLFIVFAVHTAVATDTLSPNQNLTVGGQTLISPNKVFELGFFKLGDTRNTYLGIWYFNIPLTVVWVANRNKPIRNSSAHLTMTDSGALLLYNSSMDIVWSTDQTVPRKNKPLLQILDSGNLVVRNQVDENDYAWQSFDYISDTLLPGMRLGWKLRTRTNMFMRSWRSSDDPSDGDYTYSLGPPELPQITLSNGSNKEYRWGPFDGYKFSGGNQLRPNTVFKPIYVAGQDEIYFTFELLDESTLSRFVLTQSGNVQFFTWRNHSREWVMMVIVNRYYCDRYAMCGPYANCYADDPFCRCLKGFIPRSPKDWKLLDWSDGCGRKYELNCSNRDGFLKYDQLKFPDNAVVWENINTIEKCGKECLKKCDCIAYATANVYGNGSRCLVWQTDLIDLRNLPVGGEEIYVRMARAELESLAAAKRKRRVIRCIIIISSFLATLLPALVCWYVCQLSRQIAEAKTNDLEEDQELHLFSFKCILAATNDFSLHNKIGQGGFGPVYKGELPNAQEIAVKRLSQDSGQGLREFKNEVILIAKLQHRNLVRILGCCIHGDERMLVYEYLPNKSLDGFIFDPDKYKLLPWSKRFSIILGIARGLLYLHQDSRLRIIHRDLKTSNILLDKEMNPKISDFGLARIFGGEQTEEKTKRVIGTYGYMSPEYAMGGHFSVKSDVFSYGVIVLETITGKKNWGFYHPDHDYNLIGHAWKLWNEKNYSELLDTTSFEDSVSVERCIQVALLCVQQRHEDRPTMSSVVFMLNNESVEVPQPKEPGFFVEISQNTPGSGSDPYSVNDMTITVEGGR